MLILTTVNPEVVDVFGMALFVDIFLVLYHKLKNNNRLHT